MKVVVQDYEMFIESCFGNVLAKRIRLVGSPCEMMGVQVPQEESRTFKLFEKVSQGGLT